MRKLFRFKYEPCNGTCYAFCHHLIGELRKMTDKSKKILVGRMVEAHGHLCDNPDYSFGVDVDAELGIFVAHFRTPEATEMFSSKLFLECIYLVTKEVLATDIPKVDGACTYGDNGAEDLGTEILNMCKDEAFKDLQSSSCPCKAVA